MFLLQSRPMGKTCANRGLYSLITFSLLLGTAPGVFGQAGPQPLVQGTVVTGHCQGHESDPGCVLPSLFGPGGTESCQ